MKFTLRILTKAFRHYSKTVVFLITYLFISNVSAQQNFNWTEISLTDTIKYARFNISSVTNPKYPPSNIFDAQSATCWVCGTNNTDTPSLFIQLPESNHIVVNIFSGYGKSKVLYSQNAHPKKIKFNIYAAINPEAFVSETGLLYKSVKFPFSQTVQLADTFGVQSVALDLPVKELTDFRKKVSDAFDKEFKLPKANECLVLEMEILETYSGTKYDDICISEIFFNNRFVSFHPKNPTQISKVYLNDKENTLLIDSDAETGIEVFKDTSSVLQIIEIPANNEYAILIVMPAEIQGRVETTYLLVDLINKKVMNSQLEKYTGNYLSGNEMYFETGKNNSINLVYLGNDGEYYNLEMK